MLCITKPCTLLGGGVRGHAPPRNLKKWFNLACYVCSGLQLDGGNHQQIFSNTCTSPINRSCINQFSATLACKYKNQKILFMYFTSSNETF